MNARAEIGLVSFLLAISAGCTSSPPSAKKPEAKVETPAEVQGHWVGTYYQDNLQRGYPMDLRAEETTDGFTVALEWSSPRIHAATLGCGSSRDGRVVWTENEIVAGGGVALHGRYQAAFLDSNTLVGTYRGETGSTGFFSLTRRSASTAPGEDLAGTLENLRVLADDIRQGKGSLGRLVMQTSDESDR